MGVLGRIALCYFVASLIYLYVSRRVRIAITVSLLLGYWVVMRYVTVPGFPDGGHDSLRQRRCLFRSSRAWNASLEADVGS